jgi:DNA (cytosine-5)-methyltransferase 1
MSAYYNEHDAKTAAWLRELIREGLIADGEVDERSIVDVSLGDVRGFTQCHFFAGIGGWSYALRLAGWPDWRECWTGSCPCQPFSVAGKGQGADDPRDLWPAWFELWRQCHPPTGFGEQVASSDGLFWLDRVFADLEASSYAVAAADLSAASVSAPHRRQRLYFVADTSSERRQQNTRSASRHEKTHGRQSNGNHIASSYGKSGHTGMADTSITGDRGAPAHMAGASGEAGELHKSSGEGLQRYSVVGAGEVDCLGLADSHRYHEQWWSGPLQVGWNAIEAEIARGGRRYRAQWRIKPGVPLLAHGVPGRVEQLCGFGNAIVPQVAAEFIGAYLEARER